MNWGVFRGKDFRSNSSTLDIFDPRTAVMYSDYLPTADRDGDFGFAFNDSKFSDRTLRIEIIAESPETRSDGEGCQSLADWATNRKRRTDDIKKENGVDIVVCLEEQILNCNQPDTDDGVGCDNEDEEVVAMIEEHPSAINDDGKFLLAARKCRRLTCTDYIISLNAEDMSKGSNTCIGKLR